MVTKGVKAEVEEQSWCHNISSYKLIMIHM